MNDFFWGWWNLLRYWIDPKFRKGQKILFKKRLNICLNCPRINRIRQCSICGCFVDAKVMVFYVLDENRISKKGCPERRW